MLPILQNRAALEDAARNCRRLIISSPPGSGKSTQVPQILLDAGLCAGKIAVLQPRRLAARMLARRVARERKGAAGGEVGYRVRFEDRTSKTTRIIFETEGILLREMADDPTLAQYSAIILDEFHERHLHGDLTLAACLALQKTSRPDLLVAVMSATLDEQTLAAYMSPCRTVNAQGRCFPVDMVYASEELARLPVWEAAAKTCAALLPRVPEGDMLVFMAGAYEITKTAAEIAKIPALSGFGVFPLHGELSPEKQDAAVEPSSRRKIIIATNIAETSLTIEGVTAVIDSGLARIARFDGQRGINTLFTEKIAAPSAEQRAGRAGRTRPGVCARLWTQRENPLRPLVLEPEILRLDLSEALLTLKACGIKNFSALSWPTPPKPEDAQRAETLLLELGAAGKDGTLTATGKRMAKYPLHPRYARMMTQAEDLHCARECALAAAAAQGRGIWQDENAAANFAGEKACSDLAAAAGALAYCAAANFDFRACQRAGLKAGPAAEAWKIAGRLCPESRVSGRNSAELAAQCFMRAFPDRIAALVSGEKGRYALSGGRRGTLAKHSAAAGAAIICAGEALESRRGAGTEIKLSFAAKIEADWLKTAFAEDVKTVSVPALDKNTLTPVTEITTYYRDIPIATRITSAAKGKPSADLIAEEFISGRQKFRQWDEEVEEWFARVEFLAKACPDFGIKPLTREDIALVISDICGDAKSVAEAAGLPVLPALRNWFDWRQNDLIEKHAPTRLALGHRKARIRYVKGQEPYLEAKIQDLFPLTQTPRIAAGRIPLVIHILAPSMRPVQVTKDLQSFWAESYPKLRPQLARRYPRHKWL